MYSIEYSKNEINHSGSNSGQCKFISGIVIDTNDLDIIMNNIDNRLLTMYYRGLKKSQFKDDIPKEIRILNNNINNQRIIEYIIGSEYLIHINGIVTNEEWYLDRRNKYQEEIEKLRLSKDKGDKRKVLFMQYFVDTVDGYIERQKSQCKKVES